jgi:hypothetical protein
MKSWGTMREPAWRVGSGLLFWLLMLLLGLPAQAGEDAHALLRRGISLSREASFAASVAALEQARARGPLTPPESADCGYWLANDYLALGSAQAARRELKQLVATSPGYELPPYTSPKVMALYREVKDELERAPRLKALPPKRTSDGLVLYFEPSRMGGVAYGAVYWRWQGERGWREAPLGHVGENLSAHLELSHGGTLEYYAETRAPEGVAQAGSKEKPMEVPAVSVAPAPATAAPRNDSVARKWWLWTSVAAVTSVALGVGLYYGLRAPSTSTADAVLDFQVR